ncbi:MAG: 30S ribosome-binding factor RbfA [Candidatus Omnitrophica bacterium]|nr:30S ribosome-binding factor RbfA [Candidatus Omnitrophota bacterium]
MSLRMEKVNKEIGRKVMEIIQAEVDDPAIGFLSITKVNTSKDLRESKVYFSILDENQVEHAQEVLNKMSKFIRGNLGKKMRLKILPSLTFIPDDSIRYSVHIYEKIEEAKESEGGDTNV